MERSISFEQSVAIDFDAAARVLRTQTATIIYDDPGQRQLVLHADVAGFDVARRVAVHVGEVRDLDAHAVAIRLAWEAADHPGRFPTFEGMVELSALAHRPALCQVALVGRVHPPFGRLGGVGEAMKGSTIGDAALEGLLGRILGRLVAAVAADAANLTTAAASGHLSRPRVSLDS